MLNAFSTAATTTKEVATAYMYMYVLFPGVHVWAAYTQPGLNVLKTALEIGTTNYNHYDSHFSASTHTFVSNAVGRIKPLHNYSGPFQIADGRVVLHVLHRSHCIR